MTKLFIKIGTIISLIVYIQILSAPTSAATDESGQEKLIQQKQLKRLQQGIVSEQSKITASSKKELSLYNELKRIDNLLAEKQRSNINSQQKLLKQEKFLQEKELELNYCQSNKEQIEKHIKNRLRAFYQTSEIGIINALFSSSSLPELLNTKEYFHAILQQDRHTIKEYKEKITALNGDLGDIISGKEHLLNTITAIKNHERELISVRQERQLLLKKIKSEKHLYKQALTEIQESAKKLADKLQRYQTAPVIRPKKVKHSMTSKNQHPSMSKPKGFEDFKGVLPAPVQHGIVFTKFGLITGVFGAKIHSNGIDILVKKDSPVTAIYRGDIAYAGELEGYGNVVIIAHEQHYFSLYSSMTSISVQKGKTVEQGSSLGIISKNQSSLLQKGLHLEIRLKSTPQDPLLWLDKSNFSL